MQKEIKPKIAVCVAGSGRSLENLIGMQNQFYFQVAAVVSSSLTCKANSVALKNKIPLIVADFTTIERDDLEKKLQKFLTLRGVELVVLAGFLKKFPMMKQYKNKIINIHPALLPLHGGPGMYGLRVHEAVVSAQEKESGATVHWVTPDYDEGSIISQKRLNLSANETAESLAKRVFAVECELLPKTIDEILKNRVTITK